MSGATEISNPVELARQEIQAFANKHKIIFEDKGEVGFGRPCVGLLHGDSYVNYNPRNQENYEPIPGFDGDFVPESGVPDAYHKHDCLAVLVGDGDYDKAILQLAAWVRYLESYGVEVVEYRTGAVGIQAMLTGAFAKAVKRVSP